MMLYNEELTNKRIAKVAELSEHFKKVFNEKYDNTSYYIKDDTLIARINVSEAKRLVAGYKEREMIINV